MGDDNELIRDVSNRKTPDNQRLVAFFGLGPCCFYSELFIAARKKRAQGFLCFFFFYFFFFYTSYLSYVWNIEHREYMIRPVLRYGKTIKTPGSDWKNITDKDLSLSLLITLKNLINFYVESEV